MLLKSLISYQLAIYPTGKKIICVTVKMFFGQLLQYQDTQLCVSGQERCVVHKCVIYRKSGTAKLLFLTPGISIILGLIFIKFMYVMHTIYMTIHTKFEGNKLVVCEI